MLLTKLFVEIIQDIVIGHNSCYIAGPFLDLQIGLVSVHDDVLRCGGVSGRGDNRWQLRLGSRADWGRGTRKRDWSCIGVAAW